MLRVLIIARGNFRRLRLTMHLVKHMHALLCVLPATPLSNIIDLIQHAASCTPAFIVIFRTLVSRVNHSSTFKSSHLFCFLFLSVVPLLLVASSPTKKQNYWSRLGSHYGEGTIYTTSVQRLPHFLYFCITSAFLSYWLLPGINVVF